jgi:hypothetical protein
MSIHINDVIYIDPKKEEKEVIDNIKQRLRTGKELINCELDELEYIKKPIGNSIYKYATEEKKQRKTKYISNERITCELCGKEYRRSNKSYHDKTKTHLTYKRVNDKFKQLLLN